MHTYENYVFHYTDAAGLISIVERRKLWASQIDYMNDRREGTLPDVMLQGILHPTNSTYPPAIAGKRPHHLNALRANLTNGVLAYAACFSTTFDSLTQFRMYGPPAGGFAIGFSREHLWKTNPLIECEYSDQTLLSWACMYINDYTNAAAALDEPGLTPEQLDTNIRTVNHSGLNDTIRTARLQYKSPEFAQEREVRMAVSGVNFDDVKYRASRDGNFVIPYTELEIANDEVKVVIVAGPNRNDRLATQATGYLQRLAWRPDVGTRWQLAALGMDSGFIA